MLGWALAMLVVALGSALFGYTDAFGGPHEWGQVIFFVSLSFFVLFLLLNAKHPPVHEEF